MNFSVVANGLDASRERLTALVKNAPDVIQRSLARASLIGLRILQRRFTGPSTSDPFWGKSGGTGDTLGVRSGHTRLKLSASLPVRSGLVFLASVGSPDLYVKALDAGGDFTSHGKHFRIPTAAAQYSTGVDINIGRSLRDVPGISIIRTAQGRLWAVQDQGGPRSRRTTFMYLLTRHIHFRPRHMFEGTRAELEPQAIGILSTEVQVMADKA